MLFSNLHYNASEDLLQFSDCLSTVIARVETKLTGQVESLFPESLFPKEEDQKEISHRGSVKDILEYWGNKKKSENIDYGRYLQIQTGNGQKPTPFWVGLDMEKDKIRFMVWFKRSDLSDPQHTELEKHVENCLSCSSDSDRYEYWIYMDCAEFKKYCADPASSSALEDFLVDILRCLQTTAC